MTFPHEIVAILQESPQELLSTWQEEHLRAISWPADREMLRELRPRYCGLLAPLDRALSSPDPDDWASFAHREVVQVVTLLVTYLAGAGAAVGTVASLIPALGRALERLQVHETARLVLPLAALCQEAYVAARLRQAERRQMERLVATTPILRVSDNTLLVAICGKPDLEAASALVERVLQEVLSLPTGRPALLLDLSTLELTDRAVLDQLLTLCEEMHGMGGRCVITGWQQLDLAEERAGEGCSEEGAVTWGASLPAELAQASGRRWLARRSRAGR